MNKMLLPIGIYRPDKFPGGLLCAECSHEFVEGEWWVRKDLGKSVLEIVCEKCGGWPPWRQ
jgi:hypothetical protein